MDKSKWHVTVDDYVRWIRTDELEKFQLLQENLGFNDGWTQQQN